MQRRLATLRQGRFELDFREDYTQFEHVSRDGAERRALKSGEFDALERSYLTTGAITYGVTDDLQVTHGGARGPAGSPLECPA